MRASLLLLLIACSNSSTPPMDAGSEASSDATIDAITDSGVLTCVQPENSGAPNVSIFQKAMAAPAPMGGTPYPGLYQLTAMNQYGVDGGSTCCARIAMRVTPVEILKSAFVSGKGASQIAVTYDVNGTNLVTEPVCGTPVSAAGNWAFTATGDTIKLYFGDTEEVYGYFGP